MRCTLRTKLEELEAAAEQTAAETVRLREQLQASEQQIAAVDSARAEVEAQLSEARQRLQRAEQETARGGEDRAKLEAELVSAKQQLAAVEQERAQIGQRTAALEDERDELRDRLAAVTERLERTQAANGQLEQQVAELRDAAGTATDLAQQNLIAVENRIRELNEALAAIGPAGGPFENLSDDAEAPMLVNLPLERRLHVQGLLADLHSKVDERGLMTTVPGELLFAVNSDEVQAGAQDTLAKVAELISMYDDRQVLIIGHSDAMGDAAHNRQLSERQAELVKQIFVDYFELAADRLSTEGLGESRPIAANTTLEGRRANRRVEVLILN
jgi:outer membrane protein OmpA-like peptidoglycan-associated protein